MNYLILSASLNPKSKSRELGCFAKSIFDQRNENISFFDLKDLELPFSGALDVMKMKTQNYCQI